MEILATPDSRFENLPGFDYAPNYVTLRPNAISTELRVHYVDVGGSGDGDIFLCLHGQPTWSYLYRKMTPVLARAGRVVAMDLIGFGRSDKPADESLYTFSFHRETIMAFIETLDLKRITLVCQDWGGILGLTIPMDMPERFSRMIVMNTALGTGETPLGDGFYAWRDFNNRNPDMDIAALMKRSTPSLTDAEAQAYAAPYPDARYKAGVRRFPNLVPDSPVADGAAISRRARDWLHNEWTGESFMAIGMLDPVIGEKPMKGLAKIIRGCPAPLELAHAGHFVQEWGGEVAEAALRHFAGA